MKKLFVILLIGSWALTTCQSVISETPLPTTIPSTNTAFPAYTPTATITLTSTVTPIPTQPPPEHRIAIRVVDGVGELYDRLTGEKFVPRGNNYIRLADQQSTSGEAIFYHSTFNVGLYDPALAEEALRTMHMDGYNVVRVFLNGNCKDNCIGDNVKGLSDTYIANVTDFLNKAKSYDIFVLLTTDAEPATKYYIDLLDTTWSEDFAPPNNYHLRGGGVLVGKEFWQDLIEALLAQDAPIDTILAYELRNELFFRTDAPPLNHISGIVNTANGKRYDMALEEDKQRMMDENLVFWIDEIHAAILEQDPTALVTVGFFPPDSPNPWPIAPRFIRTSPVIWESSIDFLDFHPYPGGYSLDKLVENFGMTGMEEKPIIMGEYGANRSIYSSSALAAKALVNWQVDSCKYGFDGWLLWTWDIHDDPGFYFALEDDGRINLALAPANRPDPCMVP